MILRLMDGRYREVATYAQASRLVREEIDAHGIGGTEWASRGSPGAIFIGTKQVAHVSYNGRVWEGTARAWKPGTTEIPTRKSAALPADWGKNCGPGCYLCRVGAGGAHRTATRRKSR